MKYDKKCKFRKLPRYPILQSQPSQKEENRWSCTVIETNCPSAVVVANWGDGSETQQESGHYRGEEAAQLLLDWRMGEKEEQRKEARIEKQQTDWETKRKPYQHHTMNCDRKTSCDHRRSCEQEDELSHSRGHAIAVPAWWLSFEQLATLERCRATMKGNKTQPHVQTVRVANLLPSDSSLSRTKSSQEIPCMSDPGEK